MTRSLDLTALRSFVSVAQSGGVTRAAGFLNLTQSAVSMQIKRLEEALDVQLLDRSARQVTLTAAGEQLLSYARRMIDLNDEAVGRLTHQAFEGDITLGVPSDIVYPTIPQVLRRFNADFPRMRVQLVSSYTRKLQAMLRRGESDLILTTEDSVEPGGETLAQTPLVWVGAPGGVAWRARPLRLAYEKHCIFRTGVQAALDAAGIPWEMAVDSDSTRTIEATVSADLAVNTALAGSIPPYMEPIAHQGALPELTTQRINMYRGAGADGQTVTHLAGLLRQAFAA